MITDKAKFTEIRRRQISFSKLILVIKLKIVEIGEFRRIDRFKVLYSYFLKGFITMWIWLRGMILPV